MKTVYERPKIFTDAITTYCGGCGHGIVNRLIAELIDEMVLQRNGIIVWPIGCSCLADKFYEMDQIMALHGRAPATATGIKRAEPDKFVLVYQGDGDLVSEGMAEIMHAAIRGEKFSVIFHQQRHLRHDWRSDCADYTDGSKRQPPPPLGARPSTPAIRSTWRRRWRRSKAYAIPSGSLSQHRRMS